MPTVYLIDASPYIFRAYYSLPPTIKTPDGAPANAVLGFTEFLIQVIQKENPTHMAAVFDGSLTTSFRNEIYPEYKANRASPPAELKAQIANCMEVAHAMGIRTFVDDGFEADKCPIRASLDDKFATKCSIGLATKKESERRPRSPATHRDRPRTV